MTTIRQSGRSVRRYLADRLNLLQQTIEHLGTRLREGIAAAIGQTVADAAQAAVRRFLAVAEAPVPAPGEPVYEPLPDYRSEEACYFNGWDPPVVEPDQTVDEPPSPPARPARWQVALTAAAQVLAHGLRQSASGRTVLAALGVAAITGAAALLGGPAGATGAAVVGAVLSLVGLTDNTRGWIDRVMRATAVP
jgi:hypothetical protein